MTKRLFAARYDETPLVTGGIRPHVEGDALAIREGEGERVLLLYRRGDRADLSISTEKAEQVSLPSLSHVVVDV